MKELYEALYEAMINKEIDSINEILDSSFQIIHVNGMIQTKEEFMKAIADGTLVYESFEMMKVQESMMEDRGVLMIDSRIKANIYHTGIRNWNLSSKIALLKKEKWQIYRIIETSYR